MFHSKGMQPFNTTSASSRGSDEAALHSHKLARASTVHRPVNVLRKIDSKDCPNEYMCVVVFQEASYLSCILYSTAVAVIQSAKYHWSSHILVSALNGN